MQVVTAYERYDVTVRDNTRLMHPLVDGEEPFAASSVANEEFSVNQTRAPLPHRDRGVCPTRPHTAPGSQGTESLRECPPEPSRHALFVRRLFTTPGRLMRVRLRTAQSSKALVSRVEY